MLKITPEMLHDLIGRQPEYHPLDYADVCRHGIDRDEPCARCEGEANAADYAASIARIRSAAKPEPSVSQRAGLLAAICAMAIIGFVLGYMALHPSPEQEAAVAALFGEWLP